MRDWFDNLSLRERALVLGGGLLGLILFYWLLVWEPMVRQSAQLEAGIQEQARVLGTLHQAAEQVRVLRAQGGSAPQQSRRSLLAVVDGSSKQAGISEQIKRMQPEGQKSVRLWMDDAPFDDLLRWLDQLEAQHGIRATAASIDRQDRSGTVKVRLTLARGQ